jgi:hypothetical protein
MNQLQQAALEGLVDRALTADEIVAIDPLLAPDNRNDVAIAEILSAGRARLGALRKTTFQTWAAHTGVRASIEDHAHNDVSPLQSIALTLRDFLWSDTSVIYFDVQENVDMLQAWVSANAITQEQANDLLAKASSPDPIHYNAVSDALNIAEGRATL